MFCTHHNVTQAFITLTWPCIHLTCRFHPLFPFSTTCHTIRASKWIVQKMEDRLFNNKHLDARTSCFLTHFHFFLQIIQSNYFGLHILRVYIFVSKRQNFNYPLNSTWIRNMEIYFMNFFQFTYSFIFPRF